MRMSKDKVLEYCKYWDDGNCPFRKEFTRKLEELEAAGIDIAALQPRCPSDAQRSKRGILKCICERGDKLC